MFGIHIHASPLFRSQVKGLQSGNIGIIFVRNWRYKNINFVNLHLILYWCWYFVQLFWNLTKSITHIFYESEFNVLRNLSKHQFILVHSFFLSCSPSLQLKVTLDATVTPFEEFVVIYADNICNKERRKNEKLSS